MLTSIEPFINQMVAQSPVYGLLILAVWYFYKQDIANKAAIKAANTKLELYLKEDSEKLTKIITNNTNIMQNSNQIMKENIQVMKELQQHLSYPKNG